MHSNGILSDTVAAADARRSTLDVLIVLTLKYYDIWFVLRIKMDESKLLLFHFNANNDECHLIFESVFIKLDI